MDQDIERMLKEREAAKERWETFELGDGRFPFPRKNYKYVSRIVEKEGNAPEPIQRALNYFDRQDIWVLRAESYQHLAKQLDVTDQAAIAHKVYGFVYDELPGLSLAPELYGGGKGFGEDRMDQAAYWLNWAASTSQDPELIGRHTEFMQEVFPALVRDMPDGGIDIERFIGTYQQKFDAMLHPGAYCIDSRVSSQTLSDTEKTANYLACIVCRKGLVLDNGVWETVVERPCHISTEE